MKMKKMYFKKFMSVFMAVLMLLSCWVWIAPEKASAAAGTYYVKITWNVSDTKSFSNNFTGTESETGARAGFILYYKDNNGTSSTEKSVYWDVGNGGEAGGTYVSASSGDTTSSSGSKTTTATITGFPTAFFAMIDSDAFWDGCKYDVTQIEVGASSTSTLTTIWKGTGHLDTTTNNYSYKITSDGDGTSTPTNSNDSYGYISTDSNYTNSWVYPYADTDTITWSNTPEAMTCPKTASDSAATQTVTVSAKDQYGVQMFDPTWSVKGSNKSDGITVSPSTSSASTTISVTSAANIAGTTNSQTGTVTATWKGVGKTVTDSENFTINDATYTATFKNHRDVDGVVQSDYTTTAQYGVTPTAPIASNYSEGDKDYTFTGWSPAVAGITADTTYTATYDTGTFVEADYTAVKEAIAAADDEKAKYGTEYELKYTLESRVALDSAIDAVVTGLGRTQQTTVDGYAKAINDAIAALDPNKFDVIFLDRNGAILLYEKDVEYKQAVTAPEYSDTYYDATNHYTFTSWDTNEYLSVVDDLVITPVFTAEGHNYETSTVTSTCVQKGATKYTCTVCGYSYIDGETSLGDHVWETDYTTDLEPTCTVAGSKSIHCSLCDATKDITEIPAAGHVWGSHSVAVSATCTGAGLSTKVCDDCGVCEHTLIDALGHDYTETVVNPTCTAKGYTEYVCQRTDCGHSYRASYTDVIDHSFGEWETVTAAACEVKGTEKRTCEDCDFIELRSTEALTHNVPAEWTVVVEATCEGTGYQTKTCTLCGVVKASEVIPATGHTETTETKDATCTEAGYTKVICSVCGKTDTTIIQPLGHSYDSGVHSEADCTNGGFTTYTCQRTDCGHSYIVHDEGEGATGTGHNFTGTEKIITEATCTTDGEKTVQCANTNCEETQTTVLPKTGHNWSEWTKVDATNDTEGSWTRTCSNDANHIETVVIPAGGHVWDNGTVTKTPTCEEKGEMIYKCTAHTDCGITITVTLDEAQHTVATKQTEATCTAQGTVEAYCSVCNKVFSTETTPMKAHSYTAGEAVAPTCTTSGYTPYTCACGDTYNVYDETKPATGHTWVEGTSTADCTSAGTMTLNCACGATTTVSVPALGHDYVKDSDASTEATCAAAATETYKCSRCDDSYTVSVGDKSTSHNFGAWQVKESATSTSIGYKTRTCTVCGQLEVEKISATGEHVLDKETDRQDATCTADGWIDYACSTHTDCGVTDRVTIPATGHTEKLEYTAATCETAGSTKIVCSVCTATIEEKEIPALGHAWGEGVVTNATCNETGKIEYHCTRDNCDGTHEAVIDKNSNAHSYVTTVVDATCTAAGSVVTKCTICGDEAKSETLAAKGHTFTGEENVTKQATCEEDGSKSVKCADCDETTTVVLSKKGHNWGEWAVTKASTNTEKGVMTRTCEKGCTETVEIPAGGHNLVVSTKTDATCTAEGSVAYDCDVHTGDDDCGITVTVTLDKAQHVLTKATEDATCTAAGSVVTKCENCNTATVTTVIPATGHSYSGEVTTDATCTSEGVKTYTCAHDAAHTYTEVIAKLQHKYEAGTAVDATCTSNGYTPYKCASCDSSYVLITADAKGHTYEEVANSSTATCTEEGTMTLRCACGEEMTADVPALGHDYELSSSTEATCADAATETYNCSRCDDSYTVSVGAKETKHTWGSWTVVEAATANSLGYQTRKCTVCGKLEVQKIEATGEHSFTVETARTDATCTEDGSVTYACATHTGDEACGKTSTVTLPKLGHTEELSYTAATCTADGSAKTVCTVCDEMLEEKTVLALGHVWGNEEVTPSNCSEKGKVEFTCTRCKTETKTVEIEKNKNAHSYTTTTTPATCTADGSEVTSCTLCGYVLVNTTLPMTGHNWGEWSVTKDATNTADGEMTRSCRNNGCQEKETVAIPMGGHKFGTAPSGTTPASCTKEGSATYNCTAHTSCGVTITVTLGKTQHTVKTDSEKATCTKQGYVKTYCSACGEAYTDMTLGKLAHEFEATETVDPTCTASGYTTYKCKNCDESYNEIGSDAKGHTYEEVEGSSTATCTVGGTMTLRCACGAEMTADVPALGHDYVKDSDASTEATCAAAATDTYKCSRCDAAYTISVGSKTENHDWNDWVTVEEATDVSLGYETRTCKICGKLEVRKLEATGEHKFTIKVDAESKAPTCEEAGYETYRCSAHTDCTATSKVEVPATGHTKSQNDVAPTCENDGVSAVVCTVCGDTVESTVVPALGHAWSDGVITKQPGCFTEGEITYSCSRTDCGETKAEAVQPTGHIWDNGKVITESTCTVGGEKLFKCTGCGEEKTEALNQLGHSYSRVVTPSSCTEQGYTTYTCVNCGDTFVTSYTDAAGHSVGAWVTTKEVSCDEDGERSRYCSECDYFETEIVPASEHRWGEWRLVGGEVCAEGAVRQRECTVCGTAERDMLEEGEHFYRTDENGNIIFDNILVPGCEHEGFYIYRCTLCGTEVKFTAATPGYEEELAATGHNWQKDENGDIVYVTVKAVTCVTDGEHYRTCTNENCGLDQGREYLTVKTVGHQLKSMSGKDATCVDNGYSSYYECIVCGYEHNKVIYPAMGHIDENGDGVCESCKTATDTSGGDGNNSGNSSENCDCMCHEDGFMGIIYKIVSFFWKLFGTNETCECGEAHY